MRFEYINPFVESACDILHEMLGGEPRPGELYIKPESAPILGVSAVAGLVGDMEGRVLYTMSQETAIAIVSKMNMEQLTQFNLLAKATISELAQMITGQAIKQLQEMGFSCDATLPSVVTGNTMEISNPGVEALIVPVEMLHGRMEIHVAVRERTEDPAASLGS